MTGLPVTRVLLLALTGALVALPAPAAHGDADPASDTLLTQSVFFPYPPRPSKGLADAMTTVATEATAAGFPIKVAIVANPFDLGAVTDLFGQPQRYATFLASEIAFNGKKPVLVAMPAGFGTANIPSAQAISGMTVDRSNVDTLTRSTITATEKLAAAAGHPVTPPKISKARSKSSGISPALAFGVPLVLVLLAVGAMALVRKRAEEDA